MRVAIIGASSNRDKFGNKAVRAYLNQGHEVFPVNPNESEVEGLATFARLSDVPGALDRVLLYVPPSVGIGVLEDVAAKQVGELWVNPGAGNAALSARADELGIKAVDGCAIIDIGESPGRY